MHWHCRWIHCIVDGDIGIAKERIGIAEEYIGIADQCIGISLIRYELMKYCTKSERSQ